jgi:hypothetical protein
MDRQRKKEIEIERQRQRQNDRERQDLLVSWPPNFLLLLKELKKAFKQGKMDRQR